MSPRYAAFALRSPRGFDYMLGISYYAFPPKLMLDVFQKVSGVAILLVEVLCAVPLVVCHRAVTIGADLLHEAEYPLHGPTAGRALRRPVRRTVDMISNMHLELDFVRKTAIKRHNAD